MRRGFTVVELAICLSISALLVPLCFMFMRTLEARVDLAHFHLETVEAVRTLGEQLERDQAGRCEVHYAVADSALLRQAPAECGGDQVLAKRVTRFERVPGGVELTLTLRLSEHQQRDSAFFIPLEAP